MSSAEFVLIETERKLSSWFYFEKPMKKYNLTCSHQINFVSWWNLEQKNTWSGRAGKFANSALLFVYKTPLVAHPLFDRPHLPKAWSWLTAVVTNDGPPGASERSNAKTRRCGIKITVTGLKHVYFVRFHVAVHLFGNGLQQEKIRGLSPHFLMFADDVKCGKTWQEQLLPQFTTIWLNRRTGTAFSFFYI